MINRFINKCFGEGATNRMTSFAAMVITLICGTICFGCIYGYAYATRFDIEYKIEENHKFLDYDYRIEVYAIYRDPLNFTNIDIYRDVKLVNDEYLDKATCVMKKKVDAWKIESVQRFKDVRDEKRKMKDKFNDILENCQ